MDFIDGLPAGGALNTAYNDDLVICCYYVDFIEFYNKKGMLHFSHPYGGMKI